MPQTRADAADIRVRTGQPLWLNSSGASPNVEWVINK